MVAVTADPMAVQMVASKDGYWVVHLAAQKVGSMVDLTVFQTVALTADY